MARQPKPWFRKDRKCWFVTLAGKRHNLGPDKDAAFQRFHELMAQPQKQSVNTDSVLAILDSYLEWAQTHRKESTFNWYQATFQRFADALPPGLTVHAFKPFHVQRWIDANAKLSNATKRSRVIAIKRAMNWATQQGLIDKNPIHHMERPPEGRRNKVISQDEFDSMLKACSDESFQELLTMAWETGARPQELTKVQIHHVDLKNSRWVFPPEEAKDKTRPRIVYLTEIAEEITRKAMKNYSSGYLLRNSKGEGWNKNAVNCRFQRMKKKTGNKYCLYNFRHSFATRKLEAGIDSLTVALLLGHKDPSMLVKVYQHLTHKPEHLLAEARRI